MQQKNGCLPLIIKVNVLIGSKAPLKRRTIKYGRKLEVILIQLAVRFLIFDASEKQGPCIHPTFKGVRLFIKRGNWPFSQILKFLD